MQNTMTMDDSEYVLCHTRENGRRRVRVLDYAWDPQSQFKTISLPTPPTSPVSIRPAQSLNTGDVQDPKRSQGSSRSVRVSGSEVPIEAPLDENRYSYLEYYEGPYPVKNDINPFNPVILLEDADNIKGLTFQMPNEAVVAIDHQSHDIVKKAGEASDATPNASEQPVPAPDRMRSLRVQKSPSQKALKDGPAKSKTVKIDAAVWLYLATTSTSCSCVVPGCVKEFPGVAQIRRHLIAHLDATESSEDRRCSYQELRDYLEQTFSARTSQYPWAVSKPPARLGPQEQDYRIEPPLKVLRQKPSSPYSWIGSEPQRHPPSSLTTLSVMTDHSLATACSRPSPLCSSCYNPEQMPQSGWDSDEDTMTLVQSIKSSLSFSRKTSSQAPGVNREGVEKRQRSFLHGFKAVFCCGH